MHMSHASKDVFASKDLHKTSLNPALKRPFEHDEQIVKSDLSNDTEFHPKRRSIGSSPSIASIKMQQQTTNPPLAETAVGIPNRLCSVCGDVSTGIHFGGNSCESCKAFFRRSVQCNRHQNYKCSNDGQCPVNLVTRKVCQFCRYKRCTTIGMKPKWVLSDQEREEKYGARRKRARQNQTTDEDPDIYKYLTKEEKSLIEDVTHALYQSRATYPLQFSSELTQYLKLLSSGVVPSTPPVPSPASATSPKAPNPSANFLIVPIQRLVLFARMLKDFDLFSEDDKVSLLKGSAIEVIVCSSNTLFNPKTHTFTNYLSRDQRAVMDDQIIPLDPLLMKLWGIELFHRTKHFLISMCNLHVDEVTSTLLVPVILFSPDRSNIKDLALVKRLQIKYVTLLKKYMNWRYGNERTEDVYPKLLLQIVNIRTLSLAHAEIIQKVMSTSSVDPLVQEVTVKSEVFSTPNPSSVASTPSDCHMTEYEKTPSSDMESNIGSDEDGTTRKKSRVSLDDDDSNETNLTNIWRKRRKLSSLAHTEITNMEQIHPPNILHDPAYPLKQNFLRSNSSDHEKHLTHPYPPRRPHDHQVPNYASTFPDDLMASTRSISSRHLPSKKQFLLASRPHLHEQMHRTHSSSATDLSSYEQYSRSNPSWSPSRSEQFYPDTSFDPRRQQYARMSPATFQQHHNEQHLLLLSLANNPSPIPPVPSPANPQSQPGMALDADEQQLLDAIHAHPNKRDLVLNLLRQMNETPSADSSHPPEQAQYRTGSAANYNPY